METAISNTTADESRFLDATGLAAYLSVSRKAIEKWTAGGRLPGVVKVGRLLRYDRACIDRRLLSGTLLLPNA